MLFFRGLLPVGIPTNCVTRVIFCPRPIPATILGIAERYSRVNEVRGAMQVENVEHWRELCVLAAAEQDADRLLALIREINSLLEPKERPHQSVAGLNRR
jgi:hypothetical protein